MNSAVKGQELRKRRRFWTVDGGSIKRSVMGELVENKGGVDGGFQPILNYSFQINTLWRCLLT